MKRRNGKIVASGRERGSALIATLCLIFTAGLITTAVLAISKIGSFSVAAHVELQRSMYVGEGVAARIQWLIAADSYNNPTRTMGDTDYSDTESTERFLSDGVAHAIDYYGRQVEFTIDDTISGIDLNDDYATALADLKNNMADEAEWIEKVDTATALLADYIDSDDDIQENGREAGDYEEQGMAPLPRNEYLQFREEAYYIPELKEILPPDSDGRPTRIRLIPPDSGYDLSGTPSLFTADRELLRTVGGLDDDETELVLDALKAWRTDKTLLSESLEEELYAKLTAFAKSESGFYTVTIKTPKTEKKPFRKLVFSYLNYGVTGSGDGTVHYLEWMYL